MIAVLGVLVPLVAVGCGKGEKPFEKDSEKYFKK